VTDQDAGERYELIVAPAASRAISEVLPENAAWAVIDFVNCRLLVNPHRIGYPLHGGGWKDFTRLMSATTASSMTLTTRTAP
jgi:GH18 family chitinase